ncbi:MAG: 6-phosphogluconolactonase [Muricauda sp.]|nr:lactonase family protein [Allomuricauda sp.]MAU27117.1 6-phosphogluconolactonase [Allomuricauda sp.]MBC30452.1 6-phosphogluconolactonase [Allomuricauda sp.]|tara:strand:+ start:42358 stop:43455 length:1098 start_codon:yes stop_codon:yes gene_type:complete
MTNRLLGIMGALLMLGACQEKQQPMPKKTLFVGTYTDGASKGIYKMAFDPATGTLDSVQLVAELPNPSFLAISKDRNYLYAVQETADFDSLGGGITAFRLQDGSLSKLNEKGTGGAHPCHLALSAGGQLAVSNYTGGNLAIFDLEADGTLGNRQLIDHKVLDTSRQAHVHKAHFNRDGLFAADLGLDAIKRYQKEGDQWVPAEQASLNLPEGAGPRHFVFNDDESKLYVINELNATITVFERDRGENYKSIQTVSTLDAAYGGDNSCADIHLSPDGRFLYGSNRGENTIVIFSVDGASGKLRLVGRESVQGDWPRNFAISPDGSHLLVANQKSNNISIFKRDVQTGHLQFVNTKELGSPVCLVFE